MKLCSHCKREQVWGKALECSKSHVGECGLSPVWGDAQMMISELET